MKHPGQERFAQPAKGISVNSSARRLNAQEHFDAMTREEQDAMLGPDVAEAVRGGKVQLSDLVRKSPMETEDDFITQATAADLGLAD